MNLSRRLIGTLFVIAAVVLFLIGGFPGSHFTVGPGESTTALENQISQILSEADTNNSGAAGAPQQAVAAQWATRDLTAVVARGQLELVRAHQQERALLA